jgi:hypothetical protein
VLSPNVIEKHTKTGKPCVTAGNYLVSKTADVAVAGAWRRDGDGDQSKWIDALTIPSLVLPSPSEFQARKALTRNFVVAMTLGQPRQLVYGIVGDTGPNNELGEASVEMNRILNGLPGRSHSPQWQRCCAAVPGAEVDHPCVRGCIKPARIPSDTAARR